MPDGSDQAGRLRAVGALRELATLVVTRPLDEVSLADAANALEEVVDTLRARAGEGRVARTLPHAQY